MQDPPKYYNLFVWNPGAGEYVFVRACSDEVRKCLLLDASVSGLDIEFIAW